MFNIIDDIEQYMVEQVKAAINDETVHVDATPEAATGETFESKTPNGHILITCIGGTEQQRGGSVGGRGVMYELEFIVSIVSKAVKDESTLKGWLKKSYDALQGKLPTATTQQPGLKLSAFKAYQRLPKTGRWHGGLIFTATIRTA